MNRMVFAVLVLLVIGACLPSNLIPISIGQPTAIPTATATTANQLFATPGSSAEPTVTAVSATETSVLASASPLPTETATLAASPIPDSTMAGATATAFTAGPDALTATLALPNSGTITSTPRVLTYGTLPPAVPSGQITISNRSRAQAYISLQVTSAQGGPTILEYPVRRFVKVQAPTGYYLYVAWVGGNKMVGNFQLRTGADLTIILYKDKVVIN
jgi:hypothetical protein